MGTVQFPLRKQAIFRKIKEIEGLGGDVLGYAAQGNPTIDADISEKRHFRTESK